MNNLPSKLGFYASLICALAFVTFTICFGLIIVTHETSVWTNLEAYLESVQRNNQLPVYIAQFCVLIFAPSYLIILHSIKAAGDPKDSLLSKISISFGIVFATLVCLSYFLQIAAVRFSIDKGITEGLEHWIQFNPTAAILSINMLGFTLFFGLSSLFIAPVIKGKGLNKAVRILFLLNGIFCLLGLFGFLMENIFLVNLTINLGMGGVVTVLTVLLCIYFKRKIKIN